MVNNVSLIWESKHSLIFKNKKANILAKKGGNFKDQNLPLISYLSTTIYAQIQFWANHKLLQY